MSDRDTFSIVVQGPLSPVAVAHCEGYLRQAQRVIFSFWEGDDVSLLEPLRRLCDRIPIRKTTLSLDQAGVLGLASQVDAERHELPEIVIVQTGPIPTLDGYLKNGRCVNYGNVYRQTISTLAGLAYVDTPYVIKVRADEGYPDLSALMREVVAQPSKVITNNVLFLKNSERPFQPSDHLMAGTTANMKKMFELSKHRCDIADTTLPGVNPPGFLGRVRGQGDERGWQYLSEGRLGAEQILATSFMMACGREVTVAGAETLMKDHFDVVPLAHFGDWTFSISTRATDADVLESYLSGQKQPLPPGIQILGDHIRVTSASAVKGRAKAIIESGLFRRLFWLLGLDDDWGIQSMNDL